MRIEPFSSTWEKKYRSVLCVIDIQDNWKSQIDIDIINQFDLNLIILHKYYSPFSNYGAIILSHARERY